MLDANWITVAMTAYSQMTSPKTTVDIIQPLTEKEVEPDKATQTLDGGGHWKATFSQVCLESVMLNLWVPSIYWLLMLQLQVANI